MNEVDRLTALILEEAHDYVPSSEVTEKLSQVTFVPVIGPFAVGKSTCIKEVERLNDDFGRVTGFTTRDPRPGEGPDEFHFLPHDIETLEGILSDARERKLVQVTVHPNTGRIYGSSINDYNRKNMMLELLYTVVADMRKIGFGAVKELVFVSPVVDWEHRFTERVETETETEIQKRLKEGRDSLVWSLEQGANIPWILNKKGSIQKAAQDIIDVTLGRTLPSSNGYTTGVELLRRIQEKLK